MATKKPATKKSTAKTSTSRRKSSKKSSMQTFKIARPSTPFLTFAITRQTLYWTIIAAAVLVFGFWVIHLQNKVNNLYDTVEANNIASNSYNFQVRAHKENVKK